LNVLLNKVKEDNGKKNSERTEAKVLENNGIEI
jgi:hypothetical protein